MRKKIIKKSIMFSIVLWWTFTMVLWQQFWDANYVNTIWVPWAAEVEGTAANSALISEIIQNAVNWILWILALIALIILLYAWFLMLTAAGDEERYNKWFKILKYVVIGLIFIWLARFIVSMIFFLIGVFTG